MCGIGGFSGRFDPLVLDRMNQVMRHRGPDDQDRLWLEAEGVGLAHRRLSIIDLSTQGRQPMWDTTGRAAIVFNGEIYNYRQLRSELSGQGFAFRSSSDTEVLLNLYLRDGDAMLKKLNGIFAFALWDSRSRALLVARDGMGVKPLYYSETKNGFVFASELKGVLCEPSVPVDIDARAVSNYLTYLYCPGVGTMLKTVRKLAPGHAMRIREGRTEKVWQFYELPYDQPIESMSVEDAEKQLRARLETAVERQMVADVPVGAFLSGGLDSSAVVALARKHVGERPMECFTIAFRDESWKAEGMVDDLPYAERVARRLGVNLNVVRAGPEMLDEVEKMIFHLDEPLADPAALHVMFISRLARERGIKVLLSGAGGDDLFTGYRRHAALLGERYWAWLPAGIRGIVAGAARHAGVGSPLRRRLAKALSYADREAEHRIASYFTWIDPASRNLLYSPWLRHELIEDLALDPMLESLKRLPPGTHALNRMLYLEGKHFLADHNLTYTDKMSMAAGVEVRVPYLDPDLVEFAARLPVDYKQRGATGKWILKRAMEPYLPREVIYRPKTGFGAPLRMWLKNELRPLVDDLLDDRTVRARGLFDAAGVRRLRRLDSENRLDGAYTIFALLAVELWCRLFLDARNQRFA